MALNLSPVGSSPSLSSNSYPPPPDKPKPEFIKPAPTISLKWAFAFIVPAAFLLGTALAGQGRRLTNALEKILKPLIDASQVQTREFHLGDILSITTGRTTSPTGINGYRALGEFVRGKKPNHIGPLAFGMGYTDIIARDWIFRQYPALSHVELTDAQIPRLQNWMAQQVRTFGERLLIISMPG